MTTIAVIGAGISGLSAAYYLSKATHLKVISASDFISKMYQNNRTEVAWSDAGLVLS